MKFFFGPNLKHQLEAISAVAGVSGILQGAPCARPEERLWFGDVSNNVVKLPFEDCLENAKRIAVFNPLLKLCYSVTHTNTLIRTEEVYALSKHPR